MLNTLSIALIIFLVIYIAKDLYLITKVKKYRDQIKASANEKNNCESIIEQANDAILVIDIVDGRIHQANPSAAALLGYEVKQLEKKSLFDLHPKEFLAKSSSIVADVWEKGGMIYNDIPFLASGGELIPVECSAKVAPFAGRPAIVIYARDIRERLRLESKIRAQNVVIEQKNKDILDSINYAKRIQAAILPDREVLKRKCPQSFILFRPKDIVSGDFFWFAFVEDYLLIAAADCTGHGVPGALMSMIGNNILNQVTKDKSINKPSHVLNYLDEKVLETLKRSGQDQVRDGMDIAFCAIDMKKRTLEYAGANRPMVLIRKSEIIEYKPNKLSIGGHSQMKKEFTDVVVPLQEGDTIYIFTDGYADQFGGESGKKFKYKNLLSLLQSIQADDMPKQKELLDQATKKWRGNNEQVDDILIIGLRM
ncbi:MAG: SpoIIE family protein phosphatase [Bacteroidia bacterium]|nr:SpoIIE family protein phosphatase [Bacteroidia bacterium]